MTAAKQRDAIALLKADHREVEELFEKFQSAKGHARKKALAEQICLELTLHTKLEEEIFYPACEGAVDDDLLNKARVEHDAAKVLVAEIEAGSPDEAFYDAKVTVLSEMIKHHVKEEEKPGRGTFSQARSAALDLKGLGLQVAEEKERLKAAVEKQGLPTPETPMLEVTKLR